MTVAETEELERTSLWTAAKSVLEKGPSPTHYTENTKLFKYGERLVGIRLVAQNDWRWEIEIATWNIGGEDGFLEHEGSVTIQKAIGTNDVDVYLSTTRASYKGMTAEWRDEVTKILQGIKLEQT